MSRLSRALESTAPWYEHPLRPCKDDCRYTDLAGVPRHTRNAMIAACLECPVYYQCLDELLRCPKWEWYGITAGQEGKQ